MRWCPVPFLFRSACVGDCNKHFICSASLYVFYATVYFAHSDNTKSIFGYIFYGSLMYFTSIQEINSGSVIFVIFSCTSCCHWSPNMFQLHTLRRLAVISLLSKLSNISLYFPRNELLMRVNDSDFWPAYFFPVGERAGEIIWEGKRGRKYELYRSDPCDRVALTSGRWLWFRQ